MKKQTLSKSAVPTLSEMSLSSRSNFNFLRKPARIPLGPALLARVYLSLQHPLSESNRSSHSPIQSILDLIADSNADLAFHADQHSDSVCVAGSQKPKMGSRDGRRRMLMAGNSTRPRQPAEEPSKSLTHTLPGLMPTSRPMSFSANCTDH